MTDVMTDLLVETAERLFTTHLNKQVHQSAASGIFPQSLWNAVTEAGFTAALLPEHAGGFGATIPEAMRLLQVSAAHAAPIPLAETMLANWLLARAGLPITPATINGPLTLAPVRPPTAPPNLSPDALTLGRTDNAWHLSGTATRIPWARHATAIIVLTEDALIAQVPANTASIIQTDENLAAEPRDTLTFDVTLPFTAVAPSPITPVQLHAAGAALRTVQIAGALSRVLAITVEYAQTRIQFGRPIGKFQAIQQSLAVLAGQSAAALAAADLATNALATNALATSGLAADQSTFQIGAAKSRAGEAASIAAALAHQAHGAIGFTEEYALHPLTRRLWSWRDEFGNEAEWNAFVGRAALSAGPEGLWPALSAH